MKNRYHYWHLPVLSFYSKHFYRDVATRWKGTNLSWLFLLLAVCMLPTAFNVSRRAKRYIDEKAEIFLMQIPSMHLYQGQLSVDAPQPYSIIEDNETVLLIDTTGHVTSLAESGALAFLDRTHLYIKQGDGSPIVQELYEFGDIELNKQIAAELVDRGKKWFMPVYYVATYLLTLVLLLFFTLLLGLLVRWVASYKKRRLTYCASLRLTVIALTPVLIIGTLLGFTGWSIPGIFYVILIIAYLYQVTACAPRIQSDTLYLDEEPVTN